MAKKQTNAELAARVKELEAGSDWFAALTHELGLAEWKPGAEGARTLYLEFAERLKEFRRGREQRDLVIRRMRHILEVLDSLDERLAQDGMSNHSRVKG